MKDQVIPIARLNQTNGFESEAAQAYINRCAKPNLEKAVWII